MRTKTGAALWLALMATSVAALSCGSSEDSSPSNQDEVEQLGPGELCYPPDPGAIKVRWETASIVVAPGKTREAVFRVDPDFCEPRKVVFTVDNPSVIPAPPEATISLRRPKLTIPLTGTQPGVAKITAHFPMDDGTHLTAELEVDVRPDDLPACSGTLSGTVKAGTTLAGTDGLTGASVGLPEGANKPNQGSYLWSVPDFDATIACADDMTPEGYVALGPAIRFTPNDGETWMFPREIPLSIPINPARVPERGRMRHLEVWYSSPKFPTPRMIPIANPLFVKENGEWKLSFRAPALGTYQAVMREDAGTKKRQRKLTHRAVLGISMGGSGAAMMGARHHDKFDVIAPLGGPVDWSYMLHYIENNHLGGFLPNDGENVPEKTIDVSELPPADYPYEHRQTFNQWWYEYPKAGNGGSFSREQYIQIFRDLTLMFGNPNGQNDAPGGETLPAGVPPDHPSVVGTSGECALWIDPLDDHPDVEKHRELERRCPKERCSNPLILHDYYDDEYNPLGKWPVITFCDGSPQDPSKSPYANTWTEQGNDFPFELALAVDYNGNGIRDENEPIIRAGHEKWYDVGVDGLASKDEPGYEPGVNEDPNGDDYHPQFNPSGTEGDGRYQLGEPFDDYGLDGVPNTPEAGRKYDVGEGDGKFTASKGLQTFWERDSRSILHQWVTPPGGLLDDEALARTDWWTDGGTRDLFNFAVAAQHLVGSLVSRGRNAVYYTSVSYLPGQQPGNERYFVPGSIPWEDVPGAVMYRYGKDDPTEKDIESGSGQHVGTPDEVARRLQAALYYIGARWPDAPRTYAEVAQADPDPDLPPCVINGHCNLEFTSSDGRTGPVGISFPPGYGNVKLRNERYPVIYLLHGYGMTPQDLGAAILFLSNWMNSSGDSSASRLPKAIVVYVDGRCRIGQSGKPECIRGNFFTESVREDGVKGETWWLELMDWVDANFRTMGPSVVEVED